MYLGEIEEMERYGFSLDGENAKYCGTGYEIVICTRKGLRTCEFYFEKEQINEDMPRCDVEKFIFKI